MDLIEEIIGLEPSDQIQRYDRWLEENKNVDTAIARQIKLLRQSAERQMYSQKQLQQYDKIIKNQKQQYDKIIKNQKQQLQKKDEQLQKKNKIIFDRSLARVREKFSVVIDTSMSEPHFPENYDHADVVPLSLPNDVRAAVMAAVPDEFWEAPYTEKRRNVDSEMTVVMVVDQLVRAVLRGMNLDHLVETSHNKTLAGIECDLLLVHKTNRLPFAVVEVKKPGNSWESLRVIFEGKEEKNKKDRQKGRQNKKGRQKGRENKKGRQNRVAGQVFGQMMALKLFGFPTVTGMISTGNQWRIVGLRNGLDGIADNVGEIVGSYVSKTRTTPSVSKARTTPSPGEKAPTFNKKENPPVVKREIWGSDIVPLHEGLESNSTQALRNRVKASGEEIVSHLVLFLHKAFSNLIGLFERGVEPMGPNLHGGRLPCRILVNDKSRQTDDEETRKSHVFTFGTITLKQLQLRTFNPQLVRIYVCSHLGMGDNANVCLGTSESGGSCCAVKFYHNAKEREQLAKEECQNWKKVYGSQTHFAMPYTLEVAGGHCLVMPYLYPIPPEERLEMLDNGEILRALKTFGASGFIHVDMKWQHIRIWYDRSGGRHVFIVDLEEDSLERPEEKEKKVNIDKWIEQSINALGGRIASTGKRKR